jgi:hypothetical protein
MTYQQYVALHIVVRAPISPRIPAFTKELYYGFKTGSLPLEVANYISFLQIIILTLKIPFS